jgi:hypothetical protein
MTLPREQERELIEFLNTPHTHEEHKRALHKLMKLLGGKSPEELRQEALRLRELLGGEFEIVGPDGFKHRSRDSLD